MNRRGFTLVELMVVISIISLLSAIIFSALNASHIRGRDAMRKSDINRIAAVLEVYYQNHKDYTTASYGGSCGTKLDGTDVVSAGLANDGLLLHMPTTPSNSGTCGDGYYVGTWNSGQNIAILTHLEATTTACTAWNSQGWYNTGSYCNGYYVMTLPQ